LSIPSRPTAKNQIFIRLTRKRNCSVFVETIIMKNIRRTLPLVLLLAAVAANGQKAYPTVISGLCGNVPLPQSSATCYAAATKTVDSTTGMVSIKDDGAAYNALQAQFDKYVKARMAAADPAVGMSQVPDAAQMQQMREQAMQRAAAMQNMTPQQIAAQQQQLAARQHPSAGSPPSAAELAVMKQIGQAQQAAGDIGRLAGELGQKLAAIDRSALDKVKWDNCPDVRQGSYVGPTCDCQQKNELAYRKRRVAAEDTIVQTIREVIAVYQSKIVADEVIVDNMEQAAKYGDAVSNPAFRTVVVSVQQQAMNGLTVLVAAAGGGWKDAAEVYAAQVNAASGASVPCARKGK
jgi:hypothetical protein